MHGGAVGQNDGPPARLSLRDEDDGERRRPSG